jgi:phage shock protein C
MGETTGGVLRRGSDRIIGGVASGLGEYFHVDPLLVRIVFVILAVVPPGIGILLYLVLWFLMDPPAGAPAPASRNVGERLRAMGDEVREDFRTSFGARPTVSHADAGGSSVPPSGSGSPGGGSAPDPSPQPGGPSHDHGWFGPGYPGRQRGLWFGAVVIALGVYFLLANLGIFNGFNWGVVWPIILIVIGVLFLTRRR